MGFRLTMPANLQNNLLAIPDYTDKFYS